MQLSEKQQEIMATDGHLLVTGGPGSGKTTISILKAADIAAHCLRSGQKILFLSFARATVSRVIEAIEYEQQIPREYRRRIDVETYHSFFWRILKAHGYLDFSAFEGSWSAFVSERLAYFRLKRTKSIAPVATAAR